MAPNDISVSEASALPMIPLQPWHATRPHTVTILVVGCYEGRLYVNCILLLWVNKKPLRGRQPTFCFCIPVYAWQVLWGLAFVNVDLTFFSYCVSNELATSYHPADVISWLCESAFRFPFLLFAVVDTIPNQPRFSWCVTFDRVRSA